MPSAPNSFSPDYTSTIATGASSQISNSNPTEVDSGTNQDTSTLPPPQNTHPRPQDLRDRHQSQAYSQMLVIENIYPRDVTRPPEWKELALAINSNDPDRVLRSAGKLTSNGQPYSNSDAAPLLNFAIRANVSLAVRRALFSLPGVQPPELSKVAVENNDVDLVRSLIDDGVPIPLIHVQPDSSAEMVELLLESRIRNFPDIQHKIKLFQELPNRTGSRIFARLDTSDRLALAKEIPALRTQLSEEEKASMPVDLWNFLPTEVRLNILEKFAERDPALTPVEADKAAARDLGKLALVNRKFKENVKTTFQDIPALPRSIRNEYASGFNDAMRNNDVPAIRRLCKAVLTSELTSHLPEAEKIALLTTCDNPRQVALASAVKLGHAEAIGEFCEEVLASNLSDAAKVQLVSGAPPGSPNEALWQLIGLDHTSATKRYCTAILSSSLSNEIKVSLLSAYRDGFPVLAGAYVRNGELVELYCKAVLDSDLPDTDKIALVSAKFSSTGAVLCAFEINYDQPWRFARRDEERNRAGSIKLLGNVLAESSLSQEDKAKVFLAQRDDGSSEIDEIEVSLDAIETFKSVAEGILGLQDNELYKQTLRKAILRTVPSELASAMRSVDTRDIRTCIGLILRSDILSDLTEAEKVALLNQKLPLHTACWRGYTKASVSCYGYQILGSTLSDSSKVELMNGGSPVNIKSSALFEAFLSPDDEMLVPFCKTILKSGLSAADKVTLLTGKNKGNDYPMAWAMAPDNAPAGARIIRNFSAQLASPKSDLSEDDKARILGAIDENGESRLLDVVRKSHQAPDEEAVAAFAEAADLLGIRNHPKISEILNQIE